MAETTKELKRVYNIPLRKEWLHAPRHKRARKAIRAIKEFLIKHMKSKDVKLGKELNLKVWERGIKSPPHHVLVNVTKDSEGLVKAELVGFEYGAVKEKKVKQKKTETKKEAPKEEVKKETKKVVAKLKKVKAKSKTNKE